MAERPEGDAMAMLQDFGMIKKETIKRSTDSTQWLLVYQLLVRQDGETSQLNKRKQKKMARHTANSTKIVYICD